MKMFDWLNRKAKKKNQAEIHAADHHHQEQIKNPSLELHARSLLPVKLSSESKAAFDYFKGTEEQPRKRREIVKIFVNHEEYGLLAIGTLGLYELTEIELFEVKPQRHESQSLQEQNKDEEKKKAEESEVDEKVSGALVLHTAAAAAAKKKKKLFSLDPHIRSKLLHPLNYLNFGRNNEVCSTNSDQNNAKEKSKSKSKNVSLFQKLLAGKGRSSSCTKQITNPTSSSREVQPSNQSTGSRCQSKLKKAMSQFSCLSVQVEQNSSDEDEEESGEDSAKVVHVNAGALSTPDSAWSARGDPNAGHQQACGKDMRPEYWIRTDSDYVVLEL